MRKCHGSMMETESHRRNTQVEFSVAMAVWLFSINRFVERCSIKCAYSRYSSRATLLFTAISLVLIICSLQTHIYTFHFHFHLRAPRMQCAAFWARLALDLDYIVFAPHIRGLCGRIASRAPCHSLSRKCDTLSNTNMILPCITGRRIIIFFGYGKTYQSNDCHKRNGLGQIKHSAERENARSFGWRFVTSQSGRFPVQRKSLRPMPLHVSWPVNINQIWNDWAAMLL